MAELQRNSGKEQEITGTRNQYVALILGIALVAPGFASDLGKEQRWREQVADRLWMARKSMSWLTASVCSVFAPRLPMISRRA